VVNSRIIRAFHEGGADAWFAADHQDLLGNGYSLDDYEPVMDILDVWFDSGSTHSLRDRGALRGRRARRSLCRRVRTSIAAGSSPRFSKAAAHAAGRRSKRC
jgi:hypothetical protein